MKKILITGANGQLGRALNHLLENNNEYKIYNSNRLSNKDETANSLGTQTKSLDITSEEAIHSLVKEINPDLIINCAAMTAVDLCESERELAYSINALGPKNLAKAAELIGAAFVQVSTDYVFDGQGVEAYVETDLTNPINEYGKTKLKGEEYALQYCKRTFVIRTAWLYGDGKNFVATMQRLAKGDKEIKVVSDQYGTPTSAIELAKVILYLIKTNSYGIYHATAQGSASWYEFAVKIFDLTGVDGRVTAIPTIEYPTPAKRPMYSVLDNQALRDRHGYIMMDWEKALKEFLV